MAGVSWVWLGEGEKALNANMTARTECWRLLPLRTRRSKEERRARMHKDRIPMFSHCELALR